MDKFWEATSRLRHTWQQLPGSLRPALLLLPVVLLIAGVAWWISSPARPMVVLLEDEQLTDEQLGTAVQAFDKANLTRYALRDQRLCVPGGQRARYLAALADCGVLQKDLQRHTAEALSSRGWLETESERERRFRYARDRDLACAIGKMDGIEQAFVTIDETRERGLQARRLVSAVVGVRPQQGQTLDQQKIHTIRTLVASSKAGLEPPDVRITDLRSGRVYPNADADPVAGATVEEFLRLKHGLEQAWQLKLRRVLQFVPQAEVVLDIELAPPPAHTGTPRGDAPGAVTLPAFTPRCFHVSVGVPRSYLLDAWRVRQTTAPDGTAAGPNDNQLAQLQEDTAERVRRAVLALLPGGADAPSSTVTVTPFDDQRLPLAGSPSSKPLAGWTLRQKWGLGILLLGLCVLMVVQLGWKRAVRRRSQPLSVIRPCHEDSLNAADLPAADSIPYPIAEEQQLRATLTDLVRQDPDRAARILNRWIARAG